MINTELLASMCKKIMVFSSYFSILIVTGCVSHSAWVDMIDGYVGTPFDYHLDPPVGRPGLSGSFWSDGNYRPEGRIYKKMVSEGAGKRYLIPWSVSSCTYSVYVDSEGIIRSWRYESEDRSSCVVW